MARNVFFSFQYRNDVQRVMTVRNSWVTKTKEQPHGVIDKADFEELKKKGKESVENWIDNQLLNTSVTVILIGSETLGRPFVKYEIQKSEKRGNAIIGVLIHKIKDFDGKQSTKGSTAGFDYPIYDWVDDDGYNNLGDWVEKAYQAKNK